MKLPTSILTSSRRIALYLVTGIVTMLTLAACGGESSSSNSNSNDSSRKPATVLMMGDSISSGWGTVDATNGWVNLVRQKISAEGIDKAASINIVNTSISGESAETGVARLPALLSQYRPTHVWLSHGTNDAFHGDDIATIETRLNNMANQAKGAGAKVIFLDMQIHPYYVGEAYSQEYSAMYKRLASNQSSSYVYMFNNIYQNPAYFHPDLIHPNLAGQPVMRDNIWTAFINTL